MYKGKQMVLLQQHFEARYIHGVYDIIAISNDMPEKYSQLSRQKPLSTVREEAQCLPARTRTAWEE